MVLAMASLESRLTGFRAVRIEGALRVEEMPRRDWRLLEPIEVRFRADHSHGGPVLGAAAAPAGFVTDFASTRRWMWALLPPNGLYTRAAVMHDFLYRRRSLEFDLEARPPGHGCVTRLVSRREADELFRAMLASLGVKRYVRSAMYRAVRLAGWRAWRRARKAEEAQP